MRLTIDGDDPPAIVYTSGTTGRSKGAVLSHNNFAANATNLVTCWRITSDDRYLAVLPLFHVHGLGNGVCSWLVSGCRMRLVGALRRPARRSGFRGVPADAVLRRPDDLCAAARALRHAAPRASASTLGSSCRDPRRFPAHVHEAFRERFGHTILERYGMSETLMLISNPYEGERRAGTVGFPLPGVSVRLASPDGSAPAEGGPSQVLVRGPNVFSGYWRNPDATARVRRRVVRTGDLAQRSTDGYYTLQRSRVGPHHLGRLQHLSARDRGAAARAARRARSGRGGRARHAAGEVPVAYIVTDGDVDADALRERARADWRRSRFRADSSASTRCRGTR